MAKNKEEKTNVMRTLEQKKIAYTAKTYPHGEGDPIDGVSVAKAVGLDVEMVFKTLVCKGASGGYYVFDIPVAENLDLKKAAKAVGEKSVAMLPQKELLPLTGYVHGGCSPVGMKKQFPTVFHKTAEGLAQVAVVAVDDIAGGDAFSFAVELFRSWGVGSAESDNGLGILLVKELREIRFVTGGGLEGILPDALCKRIQLNYMLPAFREGDYSAGMVAGVGAAATILEGGEVDLGGDADEDLPAWMIFTIVFGFVIFPLGMVLANYYFPRRCPKCRKLTLKQQSQQVLSVTRNYRLVEYTYVCPNCGAEADEHDRFCNKCGQSLA